MLKALQQKEHWNAVALPTADYQAGGPQVLQNQAFGHKIEGIGYRVQVFKCHLSGRERRRSVSCSSPTAGGTSSLRNTSIAVGRLHGSGAII